MDIREAYEQLLGHALPEPGDNPNVSIKCFCHEDAHESCSLNTANGGWYCHATGNKGYLPHAIAAVRGVPFAEAKKEVAKLGVQEAPAERREVKQPEPIDTRMRDGYVRALNSNRAARELAQKKLGWNPETIKRFEIGWSPETGRYTIPIYDEQGRLRNFRMYDAEAKGVMKMISWKEGYGSARLFPMVAFNASTIIVVEGEKDCVLMNQVLARYAPPGWAAVTGTTGASTWRDGWNPHFDDKEVIVIYDRDEPGRVNAQAVASKLVRHALSVKVVTLDITEPEGADITNYFQDSGKGWDDLFALIEGTEAFTPLTKRARLKPAKDEKVYEPHLSEASKDIFAHKRLKLKVMVVGKELAPFIVPRDVAYECEPGSFGKACLSCKMQEHNGVIEHTFSSDDPNDPSLVEMTRIPKAELSTFMRKKLGIVAKCPHLSEEIESEQNVEEVTLAPELEFSDVEREHVTRTAFVGEHGVLPNCSYLMHGTTLPHPRTQQAVHYITRTEPAQDSIDDFIMDDRKREALSVFQPREGQSVAEKFEEIANDLSLNVSKIYGRNDLIKAVDLCYHTVLDFAFQGKGVEKCWGDILIVGDTRTGKTETVQSLIYHYKLGEMSMGENTSFAGLVGGLKQGANRQWSIHWGRIPLNNRRLLVIDETSGLPLETISNMSGIRSNGVAEMVKIETQRTAARTRLIFLSNPRADKSMSDHTFGVEAVKELIGRPEDIARFDFVIASATNEVPIEVINSFQRDEIPHVFTSDLCRTLILWTWSRRTKQVTFTEAATRKILDLAIEQSGRYASAGGVPLVEGGNHRIKLAKLAVAAACRTFSTDETGELVVVTEAHANFAADYLDECYAKTSLDYIGWSQSRLSQRQIAQEVLDEVEKWCQDWPERAEMWLNNDGLRLEDVKTQFDLDTKEARGEVFQPLSQLKMIEKRHHSTWVKTPAFIQILKKARDDGVFSSNGSGSNGKSSGDDFPF